MEQVSSCYNLCYNSYKQFSPHQLICQFLEVSKTKQNKRNYSLSYYRVIRYLHLTQLHLKGHLVLLPLLFRSQTSYWLLVCLSVLLLKGSMTAHRPVHFYLTVINHFNGFLSRKTIFPSLFPIISWTVKLHVNAPNGLTTCTPYYFAFSFH